VTSGGWPTLAEARANASRRRDAALASGAQEVSTDHPEPRAEVGLYEAALRWSLAIVAPGCYPLAAGLVASGPGSYRQVIGAVPA
jgi:hypothetical protein